MNPFLPVARYQSENYPIQVLCRQSLLGTAAHDGSIIMHDSTNLQPYLSLKADLEEPIITSLKFESENTIWASYKQGSVLLWDLRARNAVHGFTLRAPVTCFDTNSEQNIMAVGTDMVGEDSVITFDTYIEFFDLRNASQKLGSFDECHSDDITCLKFHPLVSNAMISGSTDGLICLYQLSEFNQDDDLYQVIKDESSSKCGYFGPNYEYIYAISHMETLSIHKFMDSQLIESFGDLRIENQLVKTDYLIDCDYNDQMQRLFLLSGSQEGNIGIFDVQLGKPNLVFTLNGGHKETVLGVAWDWTNSRIFSCSEDGSLICWKN